MPFSFMPIGGGDVTVGGNLIFTNANGKIIPGATNLALRNNADSADNQLVGNGGGITFRNTVTISAGGLAHAGNLGFFGGGAQAKQTVTGSKGANAALTSLLVALANYGLITDSSS